DVLLRESALARIHLVARVDRASAPPRIRAQHGGPRLRGAARSWSEGVPPFPTPSDPGAAGPPNARAEPRPTALPPRSDAPTPPAALGDAGVSTAPAALWSKACPPSYEDHHTPAEAVADVGRFEDLDAGRGSAVRLYRPERLTDASVRLVLYRHERVGLSEVLP